ncbi:schizont egress antigen-1, putative [Plasmodium relictum]|uniref:Schizont egress antigen-1, putative n=1 Tax=Plasmodium relictum TaxID=85471 RepID=A0A1J1H2U9_PLARL|nr:schizont egress antigen-1, putative [Plasmodium relictum]CRG99079.1 schizont egress antigen-1, putative [Plasmodium relictum]
MQNKCGNEDDSYCYMNRYDLNDLIENIEENDKSLESNENNSICEYEIPFLLQDLESNKEDSEKNSLGSYLDDGASTIITRYEEENNIKKKKENKREKINIIIIQNKGVINNFEEILSMANVNDENIEKKLNDRFYQICCKSIADINTHNLSKAKDIKNKKGSLNIEHIDYGDIFLTIYDSLRNKKKDNNILHNSCENLRKCENSFKKTKMKNQYINEFKRGNYLKFHRKKENFYRNNLNNILIDKNSNNLCKRKISYYLQNNAKKNIISKYNSHVIGYDELMLKDRTFLKNFYIRKNRKKDKNMYYYEDYYRETKFPNSTNMEEMEKDHIYDPIYRNTYAQRGRNRNNYFEKENNCYYSKNGYTSFLEPLKKNVHKDTKGLENVMSYKEAKKEENETIEEKNENLSLIYRNKDDNNESIQKKFINDEKHDNNIDYTCDNEEIKDDTITFNQLDSSYNKKNEDIEKVYTENDLHFEKKRKKNEQYDYDKDKNNNIPREDTLCDKCHEKVDNIFNKSEKMDNYNGDYCNENKVCVKENEENSFSKDKDENNHEEKKLEINNFSDKLSVSKIGNYNESINSLSSLKKISEKDESYLASKEDKDDFHLLIKKYEKTKIMIDEYENISPNLNDVQKEEFVNVSDEFLNDVTKKKENDDEKKDEENEIKIFRRNSSEKYKNEFNEEKVGKELVDFRTPNDETHEKEDDEKKKEQNEIGELKGKSEAMENKIEYKKKVRKTYEIGYEKLLENDMYDLYNLKMHDLHNLKTYDFGFSKNLLKKDIFIYSESLSNDECFNKLEVNEKKIYSKEEYKTLEENDEEKNVLNFDENNKYVELVNNTKEEYLENDEIKAFLEKLKVDITSQINLNNDIYSDKSKLENEQEFDINNENNQNAFDLLDSVHINEYCCNDNEEVMNNNEYNLNNREDDLNENYMNGINNNYTSDVNQSKCSYVGSKLKLSDLNESKENKNGNSFLDNSKKYSEIKKDTECQTDFALDFSRSVNRTPRKKSVEVKLIEKKIKKKKEKEKGNENENEQIRRYPKRNRIKTLRYWIGEREITERNPYTGEIDVIGFSECKNLEDLSPHIIGPVEYKNVYLKDIIDSKEKEYNNENSNYDEKGLEENNRKSDNKKEENIINNDKYNPTFNKDDNSDQNRIKNEASTSNSRKKRRRRKFINIVNYIKKKKKKKLMRSMDKMEGKKSFFKNNEEDNNLDNENINMQKGNYNTDNHNLPKEDSNVIENNNIFYECNIKDKESNKIFNYDNKKENNNLIEDSMSNNILANDYNLFFDDINIYDYNKEKKEDGNEFIGTINNNTSYEDKNEVNEIKETIKINENENIKDMDEIEETIKINENENIKDMNEIEETIKINENENIKDMNEIKESNEVKKMNGYNSNNIHIKYNRKENMIKNDSERKNIISAKNKKIKKKLKDAKKKKKERKIDKMYNQLSMLNLNFFPSKRRKSKSLILEDEEKKKKDLKNDVKKKKFDEKKNKIKKNEKQNQKQKQKKIRKQKKKTENSEHNKLKKKKDDNNNNNDNYKNGENKILGVDKKSKIINNSSKKWNNNNSKSKDELEKGSGKKNSINTFIRNNINTYTNDLCYSAKNIHENVKNENVENENDENENDENENENENDENKNDLIQIDVNEYQTDKNEIIKNLSRHNLYLKILEKMNKSSSIKSYKNIISKKDNSKICKNNRQKKNYSNEKGSSYVEYDSLNKISINGNIEKKDVKSEDNNILTNMTYCNNNVIRNAFLKTLKHNYKNEIIKKKKKNKKNTLNIKKNENIILRKNNTLKEKYFTYLKKIKFSIVYSFNNNMKGNNSYIILKLFLFYDMLIFNLKYILILFFHSNFKLNISIYCIKIEPNEQFRNDSYKSNLIGYIDKGEKIKILLESEKCYEKGDFFFIPKFSNFIVINESRYYCILYVCPINK